MLLFNSKNTLPERNTQNSVILSLRFGHIHFRMPYTQFVQFGRIALVSYGPLADKLVVITDIVDDKRVMIDVIGEEAARQMIPVKRLKLTDFVVNIERACKKEDVAKAVEEANIVSKFEESNWGKNLKKAAAKAQLNDFQRFKYNKLAHKRAQEIKKQLAKN